MKISGNILSYLIVVLFLTTLLSCKNNRVEKFSNKSASEFLKIYFNEWNKGNINRCITMTHGTDTLSTEGLKRLIKSLNLGRDQLFKKNGGIKEVTLLNLKADAEPNKMISNYYVKYVNGGGMKISRYLIIENGKYKLSLYNVN